MGPKITMDLMRWIGGLEEPRFNRLFFDIWDVDINSLHRLSLVSTVR